MKTRLLLFTLCLPFLLIWQNGEWERFLPITEINEIISDQDYLWIATNTGLIRMDAELYDKTYFDSENGLSGDEIHDILFDTEGQLWAATDAGLNCTQAFSS
ncbi:MAG: two-component regulator propeller domain-containing protein [Bacteroidota bacterium]